MPRSTSRSPSRIQRSAPRSNTRRSGPARSGIASSGAAATESSALGRDILASSPNRRERIRTNARCPRTGTQPGNGGAAFVVCSGWRGFRRCHRARPLATCRTSDRLAFLLSRSRWRLDAMTRPVRMALLAALCLAAGALAGAADAPPPVLDRELFFGNPEIAGADLSPDGQYIAFLKPWNDTRNIYVKKTGEPFEKARL